MNYTSDDMLEIWANAYPMHDAWRAYAPKELRESWKKSREVSAMKSFEESAVSGRKNGIEGMELFATALMGAKVVTDERERIRAECEEIFFSHIKRGALRSFAFCSPRTHDSVPVEIAARVWNGNVEWMSSKITHESLTFIEVRIINNGEINALLAKKLSTLPSSTRPLNGRPSIKSDIEEAFNALMGAGKFAIDAPVKSQCQIIREWLIHYKPEGGFGPSKPGYDAIRRHLKPLITNEKS